MRALIMKTITSAAIALVLTGTCALLSPRSAVADYAKCPCTRAPQPSFPTIEPEGPAAEASEMWVIFWRTFYIW